MALDLKEMKRVIKYIETVESLLENKKQKEALKKLLKATDNAIDAMADNEKKYAFLFNILISWAQDASIFLLQADKFTKELEETYRSFPTQEETYNAFKAFVDEEQKEIDRINAEQKAVSDRKTGFEIFQAIVNGMDKEEAKRRMAEYQERMAQAQSQLAR